MAEILLRVVDKTNPDDKALDKQCSKRGDVIVVCPDGWSWGVEELKSDVWRIVKLPGVDPDSMRDLIEPLWTDEREPQLVKKRAKKLDIDKLEAVLSQKIDETKQGDRKAEVSLTVQEAVALLSVREIKPGLVRIG